MANQPQDTQKEEVTIIKKTTTEAPEPKPEVVTKETTTETVITREED